MKKGVELLPTVSLGEIAVISLDTVMVIIRQYGYVQQTCDYLLSSHVDMPETL